MPKSKQDQKKKGKKDKDKKQKDRKHKQEKRKNHESRSEELNKHYDDISLQGSQVLIDDEAEVGGSNSSDDSNYEGSQISNVSKQISKQSKPLSTNKAAVRMRKMRTKQQTIKQDEETDVLLKLARGTLLENKPSSSAIKQLIFKIFNDCYSRIKPETIVNYKKVLFTKEIIEAKTKSLMRQETQYDSLFAAFSLTDNLTLLSKLIEGVPDFVRQQKASIAREFYAVSLKVKDFSHIQPASAAMQTFLIDTKGIFVGSFNVPTPPLLCYLFKEQVAYPFVVAIYEKHNGTFPGDTNLSEAQFKMEPYPARLATEVYHLLVHCLNKALKIEIGVIKLLLEQPQSVMFDSILQTCSKADGWLVSEALKLFKHVAVGSVDPGFTFNDIIQFIQENLGVEEGVCQASRGSEDLVTPFQMLKLLRNLKGRSRKQKQSILQNGLLQAVNNIEEITNNLIDENVSLSKISEFVEKKLAADATGELRTIYEKIMQIAVQFKHKSNLFYINPYQIYAASVACQSKARHTCLLMGAGQGKTIVILLMAAYIASETTNVKIVVLNEVLKEQMLDDINRVLQGNRWISVVEVQQLTALQPKNFTFILDECDAMIKEHMIRFKPKGNKTAVYGLAAPFLSASNSFWLSATLNRNDRKLLNEIFDVEVQDIIQLETQAKICIGRDIESFIPQELAVNGLMQLVQRVKEVIAGNIKKAPIIIFTEEKLAWLVNYVSEMQKQTGVTCCELFDAKQAMLFREQIRGKTTGLLIASKEYARGLDLKFGSDSALVLVILTSGQLNYTEYTQMMGRSSRKQGTGKGMVFADQKLLGQADSIESYLKSLEENVIKEGGANLRQMFPLIPHMKDAQVSIAKQHFENDQWVTSQELFEYNRKSDLEKMKRASNVEGGT